MWTSLVNLLHKENYSCVIFGLNETRTFSRRGVIDLYDLLLNDRTFLKRALVADKVVGKAAGIVDDTWRNKRVACRCYQYAGSVSIEECV